ncbi:MAG: purine-binding chemotaxis protein CheW [Polyangiaceae bacterium]|nr:purine-binding chemotaxis protein CheW [Polyangiaceae bacterium]
MRTRSQPVRTDPQKSLVGFVVGDVFYAIDISVVREIVNPLPITPLPHTPVEVAGVADHRGEVVPVIDLRVRFGLPPTTPSRSTKWILVDGGSNPIGLVVDAVTEVFGTAGGELRPTPQVGGDRHARGITGVTSHNGALTFVLDTNKFLDVLQLLEEQGMLGGGQ